VELGDELDDTDDVGVQLVEALCRYAAVVEECPLWELPRGAKDLLPDGPVTHGPWEPSNCAELITRWIDRGWVELYFSELSEVWKLRPAEWQARATRRGAIWILDEGDARQLLREPSRWDVEAVDGQVCLPRSDEGRTTDPEDWIAAATSR
jgi:hypothetical protein